MLPNIAAIHPIVVHFAVSLLFVGVGLRFLSFWPKARFATSAAALLLIGGGIATVFATESGLDAHGPAERIPGAAQAVRTHEESGELTRNIFLVVAALEIAGLMLGADTKKKWRTRAHVTAAVVGLGGLVSLFETAEHGGELAYSYAGGIGTRTGDVEDVERLLVAGLYHQAQADREAGNSEGAARLFEELALRRPQDPSVQLLRAQSLLSDGGDAEGALTLLAGIRPGESTRLILRKALLTADVYVALARTEDAIEYLTGIQRQFPENGRLRTRIEALSGA